MTASNERQRSRLGRVTVNLCPKAQPGIDFRSCLEQFEDFCVVTQSVREEIDVESRGPRRRRRSFERHQHISVTLRTVKSALALRHMPRRRSGRSGRLANDHRRPLKGYLLGPGNVFDNDTLADARTTALHARTAAQALAQAARA